MLVNLRKREFAGPGLALSNWRPAIHIPFGEAPPHFSRAPRSSCFALKAISDATISGLPFPESVACDANGKALYASLFVSALKPAEKDGKGKITKLSLNGQGP
jgi:hypothetical protein